MVSITLTMLFIYFTAYIDYEVLMYSYIYSHKARFIQRALFVIALSFYSINGAIGSALLFYALFDAVLNKLRNLELIYVGNTSTIDKFFNNKLPLYIAVKVICLFLGIYLCLI